MNKIYRLVRSRAQGNLVVASEAAKSHGAGTNTNKNNSAVADVRLVMRFGLLREAVFLALVSIAVAPAMAQVSIVDNNSLISAINAANGGSTVANPVTGNINVQSALPGISGLLKLSASSPVSITGAANLNNGALTGNAGSLYLNGALTASTTGSFSSNNANTIDGAGYTLTNKGNITAAGTGSLQSAVGVFGSNFALNNYGSITTTSDDSAQGHAVKGSHFSLSNYGSLNVNASATGNGIVVKGDHFSLTNYNTITATGASIWAISSSGNSTIINAGVISSDAFAVVFGGGGNKLVLQPGSSIIGNVRNVNGLATLALGGSSGSDSFNLSAIGNTAQYQGFTDFQKQDGSTWTLTNSGSANWLVTGGTLNLADSMTLTGDITNNATVTSGNATIVGAFNNAGTLSIPAGKTLTVDSFNNTGTYRVAIASPTDIGKLVVTGTATLNGTLFLDVANASPMTTLTYIRYLISANNISGRFANVQSNSLLFNYTVVYSANRFVNLFVTPVEPPPTPPVPVPPTPPVPVPVPVPPAPEMGKVASIINAQGNFPAAGAATALDMIFKSAPDGAVASNFQKFTVGQEAQLSLAVSQTLPLLTGGSQIAATSALTGINRVIQARVEGNLGLSSGDEFIGDKNLWVKPFGSWANQNDVNGVSGYHARTYGIATGIDRQFSEHLRLGTAFAYANSSVNGNSVNAPQQSTVNVYQLIAYGSVSLNADTDINFQLDVGKNTNSGQRTIAFQNIVASANYDSLTAHTGVGIGRSFILSDVTKITPSIRADYTWIQDDAYAETGAGALNLNVNKRSSDQLTLTTDAKLTHALSDTATLSFNGGAGYSLFKRQAAITAAYAGAPGASFVTYGIEQDPWIGHLGAGITHKTASGVEINARYDIEARSSFTNQTASVKARWRF